MASQVIQNQDRVSSTLHKDISWQKFGKLAGRLASTIKDSRLDSYQLMGVAPKGFFIADQLSRIFDQVLAVFSISMDDNNTIVQSSITTVSKVSNKILLINDVADRTFTIAASCLRKRYPESDVKTAVIWQFKSAKSDIFAKIINEGTVICQPFDQPIASSSINLYPCDHDEKHMYVKWCQYNSLVGQLADAIQKSKWQFQQVISIVRGGYFVGYQLAKIFDKPHSALSASSYRSQHGTQQNEPDDLKYNILNACERSS